jgi:hypothetical protein
MTTQPSALPRRRGLRAFSTLFVFVTAFVTSIALGVVAARPAQAAFLPVQTLLPSVAELNAIVYGSTVTSSGATVSASTAGVVGGGTVAAGGVGVVAATGGVALAAGAIGWGGYSGFQWLKNKWYERNPSTTQWGSGSFTSDYLTIQGNGFDLDPNGDWTAIKFLASSTHSWGTSGGQLMWGWGTTDHTLISDLPRTAEADSGWGSFDNVVSRNGWDGVETPWSIPRPSLSSVGANALAMIGSVVFFFEYQGTKRILGTVDIKQEAESWTYEADLTCQDKSGNELTTHTSIRDFGNDKVSTDPRFSVAFPDSMCTAGSHATEFHSRLKSQRSGLVVPLVDWVGAPDFRDPYDPQADCKALAGGSQCTLDPGSDPAADPTATPRCQWGAYAVDSAQCDPLRADPGSDPAPTPTPTPTGPVPGDAGQPDPTDTEGNACFPSGWGMLNPVEWIYKPVKCALAWAFVPSSITADTIDGIGTTLQGKAPAPQLGSLFAWLKVPKVPTECFTVQVAVPAMMGGSVQAIDSCGDDLFIEWLRAHRALMEVVVWIGFASPLAWWAWRQYAPGSQGVA